MAKYRKVDPRIWNDRKFNSLSDDGKLAFLFLLTHPNMTALGAMRATQSGLAEELGWGSEGFREAFREALDKGMVECDETSSFIGIPKFLKYNQPESPNVVRAWAGAFELIPECGLKNKLLYRLKAFAEGYGEAFGVAFHKAFREAFSHPYPQPSPNPEPEQEPEQEPEPAIAQDARARGESGWNGFDPEETLQTISRQTLGYSATIGECRKWSRGFFETTGNPDEFRKLAGRFFERIKARAPTNPGAYIATVATNPREYVSEKPYKPTATAEPYLGRSAWTPPQYTAQQLESVAESVKRVKAAVKGDSEIERVKARIAAVEAEVKQGADADLLRAALAKEAR